MSASQFTPEARAGILARLGMGMSLSDAAQAVDINPATARGWLFRGRKAASGALSEFAAGVDAARATPPRRAPLETLVRAGSSTAACRYWRMLRRAD
jgi:transposase